MTHLKIDTKVQLNLKSRQKTIKLSEAIRFKFPLKVPFQRMHDAEIKKC